AERLQGAQFVNVFDHSAATTRGWSAGMAQSEDLLIMAQRIMGAREAQAMFSAAARDQGIAGNLPETTPDFLARLERALAGSVGAATAHAMISQIVGRAVVSVEDLMAVADETAQIMEYSSRLEAKTEEQERTARQLRQANEKLTQISVQKDAFLSQISHELRTPMTSIRAFSEILREGGLTEDELGKYASIIHDEAIRLTRLLDDLLDLSVLENAQIVLNLQKGHLDEVLDRAIAAAGLAEGNLTVNRDRSSEQKMLYTDLDRLSQVFINVIANARKYCDVAQPQLEIAVSTDAKDQVIVDFIDNGPGIPADKQATIFEKFARVSEAKAGGAGLGLAICREIMTRLGGGIAYVPVQSGALFRVTIPVGEPLAVRAAQ
ncbi:MAG: HAMP domain-containing sensor histidine kinase, partial [Pseudomonadota bacterium]